MDIKGLTVEKVLVTPKIDIAEEYYLGIALDRASQAPVAMVSAAGGVDIEQVAEEAPEKIIRKPIDVRWGLLPLEARNMLAEAGVPIMSSPRAARSSRRWRAPSWRPTPPSPRSTRWR